jgi:large subunit ribosomal protein L13
MNKIVIDATGARLGRLASFAAKQALLGKDVVIVNCKAAIVTGHKRSVIDEYKITRQRGGSSLNGPHFPQSPEKIIKRTVRGMLSYKQGRGLVALKRIICHTNVPAEFEQIKKPFIAQKPTLAKSISLADLSKEI